MATKEMMRVPLQTIVVMRDNKQFAPPIGTAFAFTADEVKQVEAMNPAALSVMALVDVTKPAGADQEV